MSQIIENASTNGASSQKRRKPKLLIIILVIVVNAGLLVFLLTQLLTPTPNAPSDPLIGHPAPGFSLAMPGPSNNQKTLSLADFKGKSIVLNFWASWCAPCAEELPLLERTWKQVQAQGKNIIFLGIDFQETNSAATNFLQQHNITYPSVLDTNGSVANKYGITSLPDTIFINRDGTVISKESREITAQVLSSNLQLIT